MTLIGQILFTLLYAFSLYAPVELSRLIISYGETYGWLKVFPLELSLIWFGWGGTLPVFIRAVFSRRGFIGAGKS